MIKLKEVTEENFDDVIELKISSGQEAFVAPDVRSIAECKSCGFKRTGFDEENK